MIVLSLFLCVSAWFLCCFCLARIAASVVSVACPWPPGGPQVSGWLPCAFAGRLGRLGGGWGPFAPCRRGASCTESMGRICSAAAMSGLRCGMNEWSADEVSGLSCDLSLLNDTI